MLHRRQWECLGTGKVTAAFICKAIRTLGDTSYISVGTQ